MGTFSALLAICAGNSLASGEFPAQRPVTRSFDVFFDLCLNKWLRKQSWGWWFETLSRPLWRHCNGNEHLSSGITTNWPANQSDARHLEGAVYALYPLQWRHNGRDRVSNHQPRVCLLSRLIRLRSKKTSKLRVTGLCAGNSPETGQFPTQRPVTRKMFPFDDVIMQHSEGCKSQLCTNHYANYPVKCFIWTIDRRLILPTVARGGYSFAIWFLQSINLILDLTTAICHE